MKLAAAPPPSTLRIFCICAAAVIAGGCAEAQNAIDIEALMSAEDGGPRRLETISEKLVLYSAPSINGDKISILPKGTVLSNLGCTNVEGQIWCEVRMIRGGNGFVQSEQVQRAQGPDGVIPLGVNDSKRRARKRDFDANADIPCAQEQGESMKNCRASVARSGGGDATVVVTFPNGFSRDLYFVHGDFTRASATMSGVGTDTAWQIKNGIYFIRVDDQRFELPSAFVIGN